MSRYIDADKLQEEFKELHGGKRSLLIDTEPTADVVEVVRCKDCQFASFTYDGDCKYCRYLENEFDVTDAVYFDANDYCSHGERKE